MTLDMIIIQGFSILAMIFYFISYQFKKPAFFYLFSFAGAASFCIHYALLGSIGGFVCNIVSILKAVYLWLIPNFRRKEAYITFNILYVGVSVTSFVLGWDSYMVILTGIASLAHTYMFFQKDPKILRIIQVAVVSPLWIIYNVFDKLTISGEFIVSIGGILTEIFVVTSSLVYLFRHRKDSKEESKEAL